MFKFNKINKTALSLLITNIIVLLFFVISKADFISIMTAYWAQSVILGTFAIINFILHKQIIASLFFAMHFGLFMLGFYSILTDNSEYSILYQFGIYDTPDIKIIIPSASLFFINYLYSFIFGDVRINNRYDGFVKIFSAYGRIISMYVMITLGLVALVLARSEIAYAIFLIAKIFSDFWSDVCLSSNREEIKWYQK